MESCGCVVTFSPGVPLLSCPDLQPGLSSVSALDILDNIFQLLFGKHVEGLPGLYYCELQERHRKKEACI